MEVLSTSHYSYLCESADEKQFNTHRVVVAKQGNLRARLNYFTSVVLIAALSTSICFSLVNVPVTLQWLILSYSILNLLLQRNAISEEAVVVMPTFGVQLETSYCSGKVQRQFVPLKRILAAVINEAVTPTSCYYYLALLLQDDSKLVLAFKEVRPPLGVLVPIWKALCDAIGK